MPGDQPGAVAHGDHHRDQQDVRRDREDRALDEGDQRQNPERMGRRRLAEGPEIEPAQPAGAFDLRVRRLGLGGFELAQGSLSCLIAPCPRERWGPLEGNAQGQTAQIRAVVKSREHAHAGSMPGKGSRRAGYMVAPRSGSDGRLFAGWKGSAAGSGAGFRADRRGRRGLLATSSGPPSSRMMRVSRLAAHDTR